MNKITKLLLLLSGATSLALIDNSIKENIEDNTIDNGVIEQTKGLVEIEKHHNKGLPLNKLDNHTKEITAFSAAVLAAQALRTADNTLTDDDPVLDVANSLILAGALSNTYDRIGRGYVVDYLKIGKKKKVIYNLSDFYIFGGVLITVAKTLADAFKNGK